MIFEARHGTRGACLLLAGLLALTASPAGAQESDNPLRFLKPWIERQLFGRETEPGTDAVPAAPAETNLQPAETAPATAPPATTQTPEPAAPDPAAAAPETASQTQPAPAETDELRGTAPPDAAIAETPAAPSVAPAEGTAPAAAVEVKPEPLRFGVLAGRSVATTMAAVGPMAKELETLLGRPIEILPLISYDAMIDAQVQRRIDGGFFSAAAFAVADARCTCLEPLAAPKASDGTLAYHAVIVTRNGSGIGSLSDLAGKTVAIGAADSLGARRMQLAGLLSEGIDPAETFGAVLEVESPETAISLVASGSADAAFGWSTLSGAVETGYSRGNLTDLVAAGHISMDQLSVIWRSPPIGHSPFAVLRTLSDEEKAEIATYLVDLSTMNPAAYDMLDPFYGGGFVAVDPQDYSGLETLLAQNIDAMRLPAAPVTTGATAAPATGVSDQPGAEPIQPN